MVQKSLVDENDDKALTSFICNFIYICVNITLEASKYHTGGI